MATKTAESPTVADQTAAAVAELETTSPTPAPAPDPEETGDNATDWADDAQKGQEQPTPGKVPTAALHDERSKRRTVEDELAETRREFAEFRGQVSAYLNQLQQPRQPEPQPAPEPEIVLPDPSEDLSGYLKGIDQLRKRDAEKLAALQEQINHVEGTRRKAAAEHQYRQSLAETIAGHEVEFRRAAPDYDQALSHLAQELIGDLMEAGQPFVQAQKNVTDQLVWVAENALRQGKSPPQVIYTLAKRRAYGAANPKPANGLAGQITQQQTAPVQQPQRRQPSLEALAEGAMPAGGGGAPAAASGLQAVIAASDREIASDPQKFRRMLGGE